MAAAAAAAATPPPLPPNKVPGKLSAADKAVVAAAFNALRRTDASPHASGLRIGDTLTSRFLFTVSNPRPLDTRALRALRTKHGTVRRVTLDLPCACVRVECWRSDHAADARKPCKRKRRDELAPLAHLPVDLDDAITSAASRDHDAAALRAVLLWVLNREEDFCVFDFHVEHDESNGHFTLHMEHFDAVSDAFVLALHAAWRNLVHAVHVDWSTQALIVTVTP